MTALRGIRWNFQAREQGMPVLAWLLAAVLLVSTPGLAAASSQLAHAAEDAVSVIVRALPGAQAQTRAAVERAGGEVTRDLPIIDGFTATLPASSVSVIEAAPGVHTVTTDYQVTPLQASGDLSSTELGSMYNLARMIGANDMWHAGFTGKGVDVALIDTGVVPVNGLTWPGKVVHGADVSFESQADTLRYLDTYGHGTHMAGIIGGRDNEVSDPATNRGAGFQGVAPDARVLSVKAGSANGAVDVSQVIAAIDWVVQHRNSGDLNIRVLNLSYGTDSTQHWSVDPLSYAAEVAWRKGIVVVAATGNDGKGTQLAMPAQNPYVIAVGASDHVGTLDTSDDKPASFSTYATGVRRPDFLAPGVGVVSLRNEGSYIDGEYPHAVRGERFFRGSGTSQSAAVTSGAVALLLQQRPDLTPDQVKQLLKNTAVSLKATSNNAQGSGLINLRNARLAPTPSSIQVFGGAAGNGSLDEARGTAYIAMDDVDLRGEQDIFGVAWNSTRWTTEMWAGTSWQDGWWNSTRWTGGDWTTAEWEGVGWTSTRWTSTRWTSNSWTGSSWDDDSWASTRWTSTRWTSDDPNWTSTRWTSTRWTSTRWTSTRWTGTWAGADWQ